MRKDKIVRVTAVVLACSILLATFGAFSNIVYATKFTKGDLVVVVDGAGVKVRETPAGNYIQTEPYSTVGTILDGPQVAALGGVSYTWWKVRHQDSVEGWSAEGYPGGAEYLQKKYVNPSTKFAIGDRVEVYNTGASGLSIRTDPPELAYKGKLYDGSLGTITGGPFYGVPQGTTGCYYFWKVDYSSIVGWSAEDFLRKPAPVISASIDSYSPSSKIEVDPGQSFTISVTFTNTGNTAWDFLTGASIWDSNNNEVVDDWSGTVRVQPGQQGSYSWTHSLNTPGEYTLQFGVWKDQSTLLNAKPSPRQNLIKVKQPATISARIDSYSPSIKIEVDPGQSFTIGVTFTNTGNIAWDFLAGASIWDSGNNEVVDDWSGTIRVQPGQQGNYSWTHSLNTPGEYTLQFGVWKDQSTLLTASPSPKQNLIKVKQPVSVPRFLTLPFADAGIRIQQGWVYTFDSDPNAHKGIDYIKGAIDQSSSWCFFDVVAAADGWAMWSEQPGSTGVYGKFILIQHEQADSEGKKYFTLYAHLDSIASAIPYQDRLSINYDTSDMSKWKQVRRGDVIGRAGNSGASNTGIHLHFEAQRGGYVQNKTDPYDLYKTRDYYPDGSNYSGCGSNHLWTAAPPAIGNQLPTVASLGQFKVDGSTVIPEGGSINESTVIFKGTVTDRDGDRVKLEIELRETTQAFTGTPTPETIGSLVVSGSQVTLTRYGLVSGNYHWQARAVDEYGLASAWVEFGTAGNTDFTVVTTLSVSLEATPSSGAVPLDVSLKATVSGTATGTINYTFYADRGDSGTNITSGWAAKFDRVTDNPKTTVLNYSSTGTYTAKVIVERGGAPPAEARVTITVTQVQSLTTIVDDTLGNGIIDVNLNGEPDNLQIEVKNNKPYWTNLRISTVGTVLPQPASVTTQLCNEVGVIPPNAALTYQTALTSSGQAITFFVDITPESGWNAATLNFTKVIVQLISPLAYVVGEDIPFVLDLVNTLTGLSDASQNFGTALHPQTSLIDRFKYLGLTAKKTLEVLNTPENRATIAIYLEKMAWFKNNQFGAAQISVSLGKMAQIAKLIDIFWQEANMIWDATVGEPAGSVMVKAVATKPDYTLSTSINPAGSGTVSPSKGSYGSGTTLTLHAWPAVGYVFDHWAGDAAGSLPSVTLTMSGNKNIIACFSKIQSPDLTVSPVLFNPLSATIGQAISVTFTVKNKGGSPSGPFHNRISLATSEWGTNYSLGNFAMDSLESGDSVTVTIITNPIPSTVPAGTYYVTSYSDGFTEVTEADEMNNTGSSTPEKINISLYLNIPGDADGDGVVDALDITGVERIIAELDVPTPGADANQDGNIDALDITEVEMIIAGLD